MSNRITRITKESPLSNTLSKKIAFIGDSLTACSYMEGATYVSPVQKIRRWADIVSNALGAVSDCDLAGDGWALNYSYLPVDLTKSHLVASGDYGGQIIRSTNNNLNYWWDSNTSTWKAVGGSAFSAVNAESEWAALLTDTEQNIVFISHTGINDYGEWSSRQSLADRAYGSPWMYYLRMKEMVRLLLAANKTVVIVTGMTAFDLTFHGKVSDYYKTGNYAAEARRVAVENNLTWADCSARLAIEAALGRPDFNARVASYKPDQYTQLAWDAIVNTVIDPSTGTAYVAPFTDSYRDTAAKKMVDETLDDWHDGTIGTADSSRTSFWANQHLNDWGQKIVANEILNIIEEYGLGYSEFYE